MYTLKGRANESRNKYTGIYTKYILYLLVNMAESANSKHLI